VVVEATLPYFENKTNHLHQLPLHFSHCCCLYYYGDNYIKRTSSHVEEVNKHPMETQR
jgi:hypothetical protein